MAAPVPFFWKREIVLLPGGCVGESWTKILADSSWGWVGSCVYRSFNTDGIPAVLSTKRGDAYIPGGIDGAQGADLRLQWTPQYACG